MCNVLSRKMSARFMNCMYFVLLVLYCCAIFVQVHVVSLKQTIPGSNSPVCPGGMLQYTCISATGGLLWQVDNSTVYFWLNSELNETIQLENFAVMPNSMNGSVLNSSAVSHNTSSSDEEIQISCWDGIDMMTRDVIVGKLHDALYLYQY